MSADCSRGEDDYIPGEGDDGSAHRDSAAGPADVFSKLGAKISCLACRAAKRKCSSQDVNTVCKRCSTHRIDCEYQRHRRGRRKKSNIEAGQSPSTASSTSSTVRPTAPPVTLAPPTYPPIASTSKSAAVDTSVRDSRRSQTSTTSQTGPSPPPSSSRGRRLDIQFSHVVPTGDSMPFVPGAQSAATPSAVGPSVLEDCLDPVQAGLLSARDAHELFDSYFATMNLVVPVLDPVLHTATAVRQQSALLYSAVLTVTAKAMRPKVYSSCVLLSNKLFAQAVEHGLSTTEIIQALLLLTHWKQPNDSSSWRKVGYAIRMAQELRLNVKAARPLPEDERAGREILNRERAWLNLVVADYHLAIHHSLPRMISEEDVNDPADWVSEHMSQLPCPGESTLAPWITFSRMCRLYADMLAAMTGDPSNVRSLRWLEADWRRWRSRWLGDSPGLPFLPPQISTIRLCDAYFRFHIAEYKLLWVARYRSKDQPLDTDEPSELSSAFCECVDASLALAAVFQNDFAAPGYLSFCFNLTWVSLAVVSVWLVKNIVAMSSGDRDRVIRMLNDVRSSTEDASRNSDDMSAYTHRLISHLLSTVSPAWQLSSLAAPPLPTLMTDDSSPSKNTQEVEMPRAPQHAPALVVQTDAHSSSQPPHATPTAGHVREYRHLDQLPTDIPAFPWSLATQQIIQENLHAYPPPVGGGPGPGSGVVAQPTHPARAAPFAMHGANFDGGHMGASGLRQDDLLFPAADDDIWRLLFPVTDTFTG